MSKIVWLSDLHFSARGLVHGHDPRRRLSVAIDYINTHFEDAACCVISGDLADRGTSEDYQALASDLSALRMPIYPMVGNHDDRALLRAHLSVPDQAMSDFVQYAVETDDALLLCLDTQRAGSDGGEFCAARTDWLRETLDAAEGRPAILFMHHPPMALGLPMQDRDRMEDGAAFLDLVAGRPEVRYLCIGHVHRPISGIARGVPFTTMRSVLLEAPPPRPDWDWSRFKPAEEAPNLGMISVTNGDVTIQFLQFCPFGVGVGDAG